MEVRICLNTVNIDTDDIRPSLTFGVVIYTLHQDGVFSDALSDQQDALLEPVTTQ